MPIGDTIRRWREEAGLSRDELATKLECAPSQIRRIEEGITRTPRESTLSAIAAALGRPVAEAARLHAEAKQAASVELSVAFVHGAWTAPLALLLLDGPIDGLRMTSYG